MTTIKIFGGLGNQIFQYIYGLYLIEHGQKIRYILNKEYNKLGQQTDLCGIFDIPAEYKKLIYQPSKPAIKVKLAAKKVIAKYFYRSYLTDFFQDCQCSIFLKEKYNKPLMSFLRADKYSQTELYKKIIADNSCFIHIRGGDYKGLKTLGGITTPEYYSKSIKKIIEKQPATKFYIFTNDIEFSSNLLKQIKAASNMEFDYFIANDFYSDAELINDPGYDLFLMSCCKNGIIANSTFSWWGAFLIQNKDKIIIAPDPWIHKEFAYPKEYEDSKHIVCPDWIKINP